MYYLLILLATALTASGQVSSPVQRCVYHQGELPIYVNVRNCDDSVMCGLPQMEDAVIDVVFKTPRSVERMSTMATVFITIIIQPHPFHFDLGEKAVTCNYLQNAFCPVSAGDVLVYQLRVPIEEFLPVGAQLPVEFRIVDTTDNFEITCFRVPILILPPLERSKVTMVGDH